ncbi:hypothetical protein ACT5YT_06705 [Leuconostoc suionicum]
MADWTSVNVFYAFKEEYRNMERYKECYLTVLEERILKSIEIGTDVEILL